MLDQVGNTDGSEHPDFGQCRLLIETQPGPDIANSANARSRRSVTLELADGPRVSERSERDFDRRVVPVRQILNALAVPQSLCRVRTANVRPSDRTAAESVGYAVQTACIDTGDGRNTACFEPHQELRKGRTSGCCLINDRSKVRTEGATASTSGRRELLLRRSMVWLLLPVYVRAVT